MPNMKYHDFRDYLPFYRNDFIKSIASNRRWSVSDKSKVPCNMSDLKALIETKDSRIHVRGANMYHEDNMTTLKECIKLIPNIANHAYMLDCQREGWVVLDIEKTCPDELKQKFLKLPYLYGERSLSGEGIHLICKLPENWNEHPEYHNAVKLQSKEGWYEMLMMHWVTFTRNWLTPMSSEGDGSITVADVFNSLIKQNKAVKAVKAKAITKKPEIPEEKRLLRLMNTLEYHKEPKDFPKLDKYDRYLGPDLSKYEFGYSAYLAYYLIKLIDTRADIATNHYNDEQIAYVVYELLQKRLEHRSKHDTRRNGMPLLLYDASIAVAKVRLDNEEREKMRKEKRAQRKAEKKKQKEKKEK